MGNGMRALKAATIGMGLLIVLGTTVLIATIVKRSAAPGVPVDLAAVLDEPAGTRIVGIAPVGDWLAVQLQGGGADRVVLVNPHTAAVAGPISMGR